jgi:hypothetical protein
VWSHHRDFDEQEIENHIAIGAAVQDQNLESFSFNVEVTVPTTLEYIEIRFDEAPTSTVCGNVIIEQLNYYPGTESQVIYLTDLYNEQTIQITGCHNFEYIPSTGAAAVANPEKQPLYGDNKLTDVVQMFRALRESGIGPAFPLRTH